MTNIEKLSALFSKEDFFEVNKNAASVEEILQIVHKEYPEITEEELYAYLQELSAQMHKLDGADGELKEDELENVAGGGITLGTILLIGAAAYAGYKAGEKIGEFIYNVSSSKKKK
jgi:lactobin A/cerein 7B family class IIb bacteriocin